MVGVRQTGARASDVRRGRGGPPVDRIIAIISDLTKSSPVIGRASNSTPYGLLRKKYPHVYQNERNQKKWSKSENQAQIIIEYSVYSYGRAYGRAEFIHRHTAKRNHAYILVANLKWLKAWQQSPKYWDKIEHRDLFFAR